MSEYTPTTEEVRAGDYKRDGVWHGISPEEFDRWLEARDAEVRARALHDAFWAVHVHRFDHTNGLRPMNSLYAGVQAAKIAIAELHGAPIVGPWPPVGQEGGR